MKVKALQFRKVLLIPFLLLTIFCFSQITFGSSFLMSSDSTVKIYRVQIASRSTDTEAAAIQQQVQSAGISNVSIQTPENNHLWRVLAGPFPTKSESSTTLKQIKAMGFSDALIVTTSIPVEKAQEWNLPLINTPYRQILSDASLQNSGSLDSVYTQALQLSESTDTSQLQNAISSFAEIIHRYPNSTQALQSRYNMGQIYATWYSKLRQSQCSR